MPVTGIHLPIYAAANSSPCSVVLFSYKPSKCEGLTFTKTFLGLAAEAGAAAGADVLGSSEPSLTAIGNDVAWWLNLLFGKTNSRRSRIIVAMTTSTAGANPHHS